MKYYQPYGEEDTNASYSNGNAIAGVKGSIPDARAVEHPMREILAVIVAAGLTPNEADLTQLLDAIMALIGAATPNATIAARGLIELADSGEALGGTDNQRAVTSAGLASAKTLGTTGHYKLPGGFVLNWGQITITSVSANKATGTAIFSAAFTLWRIGTLKIRSNTTAIQYAAYDNNGGLLNGVEVGLVATSGAGGIGVPVEYIFVGV